MKLHVKYEIIVQECCKKVNLRTCDTKRENQIHVYEVICRIKWRL